MREETTTDVSTALSVASRWRTIARSGTIPAPPPINSSGPPSSACQENDRPPGPRSSNWSPSRSSPASHGETSPSSRCSTQSSNAASSGAVAIEYGRWVR